MIHGEPIVQLVNDTTDLIGIRTLVMSQFWQPTVDGLVAALGEKPKVPEAPEGVILVGEQTRRHGGGMRTAWTFQGINGDGNSVTFKNRDTSIDFGFEPGFAQIAIQLHPNFPEMLETYGGYPDNEGQRVIWPADMPDTKKSGGNKKTAEAGEKNPMYGIQDWFRMEGTYRFRYAEAELPKGFYDLSGTIVPTGDLPGEPPPTTEDRNWLFVPPPFRQRGTIKDITEMYWLSGPGGWPTPVYGDKLVPVDVQRKAAGAAKPRASLLKLGTLGTGRL